MFASGREHYAIYTISLLPQKREGTRTPAGSADIQWHLHQQNARNIITNQFSCTRTSLSTPLLRISSILRGRYSQYKCAPSAIQPLCPEWKKGMHLPCPATQAQPRSPVIRWVNPGWSAAACRRRIARCVGRRSPRPSCDPWERRRRVRGWLR